MSSENGDQVLAESPVESKLEAPKKPKKLYTREFLLSLSDLDICKKLPSGFNASVLSEFEDASNTTFDRQRSTAGSSLLSLKKNDYGSLPQNRFEGSSSYTRGNVGRWDTRSTGSNSSDRDGDLLSDKESLGQDSGRRFGNQTRRVWQQQEHDGLLGSGAFPRPSGYAGASAPKFRGNGQYQLNRSTEPYQPPRPYKAGPYLRKDSTDSYNDETFGSAEYSSEDRAEEERKRRESFELMRKEQHKALQEKQKSNFDNHKENLDVDIMALLKNSEDVKNTDNINKPEDSIAVSLSHNDSSRSSSHIPNPTSRPLVPPGFANALADKNLSAQSLSTSLAPEVGSVLEEQTGVLNGMEKDKEIRDHSISPVLIDMQKKEHSSTMILSVDASDQLVAPSSSVEVLKKTVGLEDVSSKIYGLQEASEFWEDDIVNDFSHNKETRTEFFTDTQDHSTILEKLFSSALSKKPATSHIYSEHQDIKVDEETWRPAGSESSRFARWFHEEEKKSVEDSSSRNLLNLIVSNEKIGSEASVLSRDQSAEHLQSSLSPINNDTVSKLLTSSVTSTVVGNPEQYVPGDKQSSSSVVLTCEDLEQSILAEVEDSSSSSQHSVRRARDMFDSKFEVQKVDVDNRASQHLLSLLQKGATSIESVSSPRLDATGSRARFDAYDVKASDGIQVADSASVRNSEEVHSSGKNLTLEALFGAAFMNALHSVEAPVSAQRGLSGGVNNVDITQSHGFPSLHADSGSVSSTYSESRSIKSIQGDVVGPVVSPHEIPKGKAHSIQGPWVGNHGESLVEPPMISDMGIEAGLDIHLPEEDSLITLGDTLDPIASEPLPFGNTNKTAEPLSERTVENLNEKLFNSILQDGEHLRMQVPQSPPLMHSSNYEVVEPDSLHHYLLGRPSSQFSHQMNQSRPVFPQMDHLAHRNPQMKFAAPDGMHHDPHHSFPANVIPHHALNAVGAPRFDPAANHPMLQHLAVPGNFPPHHPIQGVPRGVPLSHPINHMPGYMPELNNIHTFPLHHRPNYGGGLGIGLTGSVVGVSGGARPEALERLIEMEMRANSKQIHPVAGGHVHGMYSRELDMNFRYR